MPRVDSAGVPKRMPVLTAVLSVVLLGERFEPTQLLGGGAVLAGVYWSTRARPVCGRHPARYSDPGSSPRTRASRSR